MTAKPEVVVGLWARLLALKLNRRWALPPHVRYVLSTLTAHGFEAYAVGGAVRDRLLGRQPGDWDVATSAEPRYVLSVFARAIPIGIKHGSVKVLCPGRQSVDVTTFRVEGTYTDLRRPDTVEFTASLTEDLGRRDFTVNALALSLSGAVADPYNGLPDLSKKIIRCVGDPDARLSEDALRMMRAVRLAAELGFSLEPDTAVAISRHAPLLGRIAIDRIREELNRCLVSSRPEQALEMLRDLGLLESFLPELLEGVAFEQNEHHAHTVWEHTLLTLAGVGPSLHLRLAALLHDVAKPRTLSIEDGRRHFFGHERTGAEMAADILSRLHYDRDTTERVVHLVRHHMALHWQPEMKDAGVRRLINRVGPENIPDLVELRRADRRATGTREGSSGIGAAALLVRIERLLREGTAFTVADLAVDGNDVMRVARIGPGPQVGLVLRRLLEEVLEDPGLNDKARLEARVKEMARHGLPH